MARQARARLEQQAESARLAAVALTEEGKPTAYLRAMFIAEDETCFYVFTSASASNVQEACERAGINFERILETDGLESGPPTKTACDQTRIAALGATDHDRKERR